MNKRLRGLEDKKYQQYQEIYMNRRLRGLEGKYQYGPARRRPPGVPIHAITQIYGGLLGGPKTSNCS